ncbi:MAG TPA: methionine synthase [Bacteroides sp.]|nr:methionine synthase [Bacteroides sp.]
MGILLDRIREKGVLISDGAWGTLLHRKGLASGECPESWNLTRPEDVLEVARSYVEAGSDIILTNSFGGSPAKLRAYGLEQQVYEINRAAAGISRKAAGKKVLVLGSVGPTGKLVMMGEITPEELLDGFQKQVTGLADGGVDGIVVETMADPDEARLAIQAAKNGTSLEVACTFTFERTRDSGFRTIMGTGIREYLEMCREEGVDVIGANCGNGTAGMIEIVREIRRTEPDLPVLVHANAGLPVYRDGETVFPETPGEMAPLMVELVNAGANIVGGCCGTTPEHIRLIAAMIKNKIITK